MVWLRVLGGLLGVFVSVTVVAAPMSWQPECPAPVEACDVSSDGVLLVQSVDRDGDGRWDTRAFWDIATRAQVVGEVDWQGDGRWDTRATFDRWGFAQLHEQDRDQDGVADWSNLLTFDDAGRITHQAIDQDGDGDVDSLVLAEFDAQGRLLVWARDDDADGRLDWTQSFDYDLDTGARIREVIDTNGDGQPETDHVFEPPCGPPYETCTTLPPPC